MNERKLELLGIQQTFDNEGKRLDVIINNKDRTNETLGTELKKEKERLFAMTRNYDQQIGKLVIEKDNILADFTNVNNQKHHIGK